MDQKEIRLDEVKVLEQYMNENGLGQDSNGSIRRYVGRRRTAIGMLPVEPNLSETAVRLSEMYALETYLDQYNIGRDTSEHSMRVYLKKRRGDIAYKAPTLKPLYSAPPRMPARASTAARPKPPYTR